MMNCFCGMVDRQKAFSLISSRDHCQRSSPSRISDTPQAGFEPAQNMSSGFLERSYAAVITTAPRRRIDEDIDWESVKEKYELIKNDFLKAFPSENKPGFQGKLLFIEKRLQQK